MNKWMICAGDTQADAIEAHLKQAGVTCIIRYQEETSELRSLLKHMPLSFSVAVGEGTSGPDAVNLAAALVHDACSLEVVLVVKDASGSLRSRAKRAGINRVVSEAELTGVREKRRFKEHAPSGVEPSLGAGGDTRKLNRLPDPACEPKDSATQVLETAQEDKPVREQTATPKHKAPFARRGGVPVITFVSGRGGVGKTTICALAGYIAASWGMRVALLDLDLAFGNLSALCGLEHMGDLASLVEEQTISAETLATHGMQAAKNLDVYGPCQAPEYAETVQPYAAQLISVLTQSYDLVLVDTTNNWNDAVACAAQIADRVVIVSDERPGAIPALARCGGLAVRLGIARTRIVRLMNGVSTRSHDDSFVSRAAAGLECSRELRVFDGDIEALELLSCGKIAELISLENPLATSVASGLAQILRELGSLPQVEEAQSALTGTKRRGSRFFRRKKQLMAYERS